MEDDLRPPLRHIPKLKRGYPLLPVSVIQGTTVLKCLIQVEMNKVADALEERVEGYVGVVCDLFAWVDADAGASGGDGGGTSGGGGGEAGEDAPMA